MSADYDRLFQTADAAQPTAGNAPQTRAAPASCAQSGPRPRAPATSSGLRHPFNECVRWSRHRRRNTMPTRSRPRGAQLHRTRAAPAHNGDDGRSPRHRCAFPRRCACCGQDAVAARLAPPDLPADPHQSGVVARRAVRDGSAFQDPPKCPRLLPDWRPRAEGWRRQDGRHRRAGLVTEQDPRRPDPGLGCRPRLRQPSRPCRAPVRGDRGRSAVRERVGALQRYSRIHQHQ